MWLECRDLVHVTRSYIHVPPYSNQAVINYSVTLSLVWDRLWQSIDRALHRIRLADVLGWKWEQLSHQIGFGHPKNKINNYKLYYNQFGGDDYAPTTHKSHTLGLSMKLDTNMYLSDSITKHMYVHVPQYLYSWNLGTLDLWVDDIHWDWGVWAWEDL